MKKKKSVTGQKNTGARTSVDRETDVCLALLFLSQVQLKVYCMCYNKEGASW